MPTKPKVKAKVEDAGKILECFEAYDANGDGHIAKDELARVLQDLDKSTWSDKKVDALMKSIDINKDGKIDYDEFTRWLVGTKPEQKAVLKAGEKASAEVAAAEKEGEGELDAVLKELFTFYDEDGDGQIERIELLDGEERRLGKMDFGPKQRKEVIAWFKEAGAEGTPIDGMFLSEDKWKAAIKKSAAEGCELDADTKEFGKLATWLREQRLQPLLDFAKAAAEAAEASKPKVVEVVVAKPGDPPPEYPVTCALSDLNLRINEARSFEYWPLVLSSGLLEVETFLSYQTNSLIDCKQLIAEMFVQKTKTKDVAQGDAKNALRTAMNSSGFTKPLHIRLGNSAFDWVGFMKDCESLPDDLFDPSLWTIDRAFGLDYFDAGYKNELEISDRKKWKEFYVLISSTYDLEKAKELLSDKIPHFGKFAVIIVDPASVEK